MTPKDALRGSQRTGHRILPVYTPLTVHVYREPPRTSSRLRVPWFELAARARGREPASGRTLAAAKLLERPPAEITCRPDGRHPHALNPR